MMIKNDHLEKSRRLKIMVEYYTLTLRLSKVLYLPAAGRGRILLNIKTTRQTGIIRNQGVIFL